MRFESLPNASNTSREDFDKVAQLFPELIKSLDGIEKDGKPLDGACVLLTNTKGKQNAITEQGRLLEAWSGHAILLGDTQGERMAVLGIDNAISLYFAVLNDGGKPCILCLPDNLGFYFERMAKAWSVEKIFTTHDQPINADCTVISTVAPLAIELAHQSYFDLMNDADTAIDEAWGEIVPLRRGRKIDNPYPVDAFGSLSDVVKMLAYYAQVPLSWAGQSVLGVLATIGQAKVNAPFGHDHKPTSLYILTEGESGGGKTQVQELAYKAIREHDKKVYTEYSNKMQLWLTGQAMAKNKGQYLAENPKPENEKLTVDDATVEPILDKFVIYGRKNLSWRTSEAAKFFGGYSMKSDTSTSSMGNLTDLYSTGTVSRVRSQRGIDKAWQEQAYDCRFTMDMSGQRVVIEPVIANQIMSEQGLIPRFLLSAEPSIIGYRDWSSNERLTADPYSDSILMGFWARCDYLLKEQDTTPSQHNPFTDPTSTDDFGRYNMPFGQGARECLATLQQQLEVKQRDGEPLHEYRAFASRVLENTSRVATLLAYYDGLAVLDKVYIEQAVKIAMFSLNERINYFENETEPTAAERLLKTIIDKANGGKVLYSEVQAGAPKHLRRKQEFELQIAVLQDGNHIKIKEIDSKRVIFINPIYL